MAGASSASVAAKQIVAFQADNLDNQSMVSAGEQLVLRASGEDVIYQAPAPANTHKMYLCVYDCGPARPDFLMTNTATAQNPRWMCRPCNNARKALEWMANKDKSGQLKSALDDLKKNDPEAWKAKVRATRIRDPAEPAGLPGVDSLGARKASVNSFTHTLRQTVGISEQVSVTWLKFNQFIAHMANVENIKDESQARKLWEEHVKNRDIQRRGEGKTLEIAVSLPAVTVGYRSREMERTFRREHAVESISQAEKAIENLGTVGAGQASLSSSAFGSMGEAFKVGAAGSADLDPAASAGFSSGPLAAPPSSAVVAIEDFAPYGTSSGGQGKRGLAACVSDPGNPKRSAKRGRFTRSGVTGEVAEAAAWAKNAAKAAHSQYGLARVNLSKQINALAVKASTELPEDVTRDCKRYQALLTKISLCSETASKWTASNILEKKTAIQRDIAELSQLAVLLSDKLGQLMVQSKADKEQKAKEERTSAINRERKIRGYLSSNSPAVLCRWLYSIEAIGCDGKSAGKTIAPPLEESVDEEVSSEVSHNIVVRNLEWHKDSQAIDPQKPAIFLKDCKGVGETLGHLPDALGKQRVQQAIDKMVDFLHSNQAAAASSDDLFEPVGMLRMPPKGGGQDTVEALTWVPEAWKKNGMVPEALRSYGAPWLLTGQPGSCRYGDATFAFPGIGRYLNVVAGAVILVMFPYVAIEERGASMAMSSDFLFSLALKTFTEFANSEFRVATLVTGCGAWVPYGWKVFLVTPVNEPQCSQVMDVVYFAGDMTKALPNRASLMSFNRGLTSTAVCEGNKPWDTIGQPFLDWLDIVNPGSERPESQDVE